MGRHPSWRAVKLLATNETPSTGQLIANYDPAAYGYTLTIVPQGAHSTALDLS
jgi:hypothetical protein